MKTWRARKVQVDMVTKRARVWSDVPSSVSAGDLVFVHSDWRRWYVDMYPAQLTAWTGSDDSLRLEFFDGELWSVAPNSEIRTGIRVSFPNADLLEEIAKRVNSLEYRIGGELQPRVSNNLRAAVVGVGADRRVRLSFARRVNVLAVWASARVGGAVERVAFVERGDSWSALLGAGLLRSMRPGDSVVLYDYWRTEPVSFSVSSAAPTDSVSDPDAFSSWIESELVSPMSASGFLSAAVEGGALRVTYSAPLGREGSLPAHPRAGLWKSGATSASYVFDFSATGDHRLRNTHLLDEEGYGPFSDASYGAPVVEATDAWCDLDVSAMPEGSLVPDAPASALSALYGWTESSPGRYVMDLDRFSNPAWVVEPDSDVWVSTSYAKDGALEGGRVTGGLHGTLVESGPYDEFVSRTEFGLRVNGSGGDCSWESGVMLGGEWCSGSWASAGQSASDPVGNPGSSIWRSGLWRSGTFSGGVWRDGLWLSEGTGSVWNTGYWQGGRWRGGDFLSGRMSSDWALSTWEGGRMLGGETSDVRWMDGSFLGGRFNSVTRFGLSSVRASSEQLALAQHLCDDQKLDADYWLRVDRDWWGQLFLYRLHGERHGYARGGLSMQRVELPREVLSLYNRRYSTMNQFNCLEWSVDPESIQYRMARVGYETAESVPGNLRLRMEMSAQGVLASEVDDSVWQRVYQHLGTDDFVSCGDGVITTSVIRRGSFLGGEVNWSLIKPTVMELESVGVDVSIDVSQPSGVSQLSGEFLSKVMHGTAPRVDDGGLTVMTVAARLSGSYEEHFGSMRPGAPLAVWNASFVSPSVAESVAGGAVAREDVHVLSYEGSVRSGTGFAEVTVAFPSLGLLSARPEWPLRSESYSVGTDSRMARRLECSHYDSLLAGGLGTYAVRDAYAELWNRVLVSDVVWSGATMNSGVWVSGVWLDGTVRGVDVSTGESYDSACLWLDGVFVGRGDYVGSDVRAGGVHAGGLVDKARVQGGTIDNQYSWTLARDVEFGVYGSASQPTLAGGLVEKDGLLVNGLRYVGGSIHWVDRWRSGLWGSGVDQNGDALYPGLPQVTVSASGADVVLPLDLASLDAELGRNAAGAASARAEAESLLAGVLTQSVMDRLLVLEEDAAEYARRGAALESMRTSVVSDKTGGAGVALWSLGLDADGFDSVRAVTLDPHRMQPGYRFMVHDAKVDVDVPDEGIVRFRLLEVSSVLPLSGSSCGYGGADDPYSLWLDKRTAHPMRESNVLKVDTPKVLEWSDSNAPPVERTLLPVDFDELFSTKTEAGYERATWLPAAEAASYNDTQPLRLHGTFATCSVFSGRVWEGGDFNVSPATATAAGKRLGAFWLRGAWKGGTWWEGVWSPDHRLTSRDSDSVRDLRVNTFSGGLWRSGLFMQGYAFGGRFESVVVGKCYMSDVFGDLELNSVSSYDEEVRVTCALRGASLVGGAGLSDDRYRLEAEVIVSGPEVDMDPASAGFSAVERWSGLLARPMDVVSVTDLFVPARFGVSSAVLSGSEIVMRLADSSDVEWAFGVAPGESAEFSFSVFEGGQSVPGLSVLVTGRGVGSVDPRVFGMWQASAIRRSASGDTDVCLRYSGANPLLLTDESLSACSFELGVGEAFQLYYVRSMARTGFVSADRGKWAMRFGWWGHVPSRWLSTTSSAYLAGGVVYYGVGARSGVYGRVISKSSNSTSVGFLSPNVVLPSVAPVASNFYVSAGGGTVRGVTWRRSFVEDALLVGSRSVYGSFLRRVSMDDVSVSSSYFDCRLPDGTESAVPVSAVGVNVYTELPDGTLVDGDVSNEWSQLEAVEAGVSYGQVSSQWDSLLRVWSLTVRLGRIRPGYTEYDVPSELPDGVATWKEALDPYYYEIGAYAPGSMVSVAGLEGENAEGESGRMHATSVGGRSAVPHVVLHSEVTVEQDDDAPSGVLARLRLYVVSTTAEVDALDSVQGSPLSRAWDVYYTYKKVSDLARYKNVYDWHALHRAVSAERRHAGVEDPSAGTVPHWDDAGFVNEAPEPSMHNARVQYLTLPSSSTAASQFLNSFFEDASRWLGIEMLAEPPFAVDQEEVDSPGAVRVTPEDNPDYLYEGGQYVTAGGNATGADTPHRLRFRSFDDYMLYLTRLMPPDRPSRSADQIDPSFFAPGLRVWTNAEGRVRYRTRSRNRGAYLSTLGFDRVRLVSNLSGASKMSEFRGVFTGGSWSGAALNGPVFGTKNVDSLTLGSGETGSVRAYVLADGRLALELLSPNDLSVDYAEESWWSVGLDVVASRVAAAVSPSAAGWADRSAVVEVYGEAAADGTRRSLATVFVAESIGLPVADGPGWKATWYFAPRPSAAGAVRGFAREEFGYSLSPVAPDGSSYFSPRVRVSFWVEDRIKDDVFTGHYSALGANGMLSEAGMVCESCEQRGGVVLSATYVDCVFGTGVAEAVNGWRLEDSFGLVWRDGVMRGGSVRAGFWEGGTAEGVTWECTLAGTSWEAVWNRGRFVGGEWLRGSWYSMDARGDYDETASVFVSGTWGATEPEWVSVLPDYSLPLEENYGARRASLRRLGLALSVLEARSDAASLGFVEELRRTASWLDSAAPVVNTHPVLLNDASGRPLNSDTGDSDASYYKRFMSLDNGVNVDYAQQGSSWNIGGSEHSKWSLWHGGLWNVESVRYEDVPAFVSEYNWDGGSATVLDPSAGPVWEYASRFFSEGDERGLTGLTVRRIVRAEKQVGQYSVPDPSSDPITATSPIGEYSYGSLIRPTENSDTYAVSAEAPSTWKDGVWLRGRWAGGVFANGRWLALKPQGRGSYSEVRNEHSLWYRGAFFGCWYGGEWHSLRNDAHDPRQYDAAWVRSAEEVCTDFSNRLDSVMERGWNPYAGAQPRAAATDPGLNSDVNDLPHLQDGTDINEFLSAAPAANGCGGASADSVTGDLSSYVRQGSRRPLTTQLVPYMQALWSSVDKSLQVLEARAAKVRGYKGVIDALVSERERVISSIRSKYAGTRFMFYPAHDARFIEDARVVGTGVLPSSYEVGTHVYYVSSLPFTAPANPGDYQGPGLYVCSVAGPTPTWTFVSTEVEVDLTRPVISGGRYSDGSLTLGTSTKYDHPYRMRSLPAALSGDSGSYAAAVDLAHGPDSLEAMAPQQSASPSASWRATYSESYVAEWRRLYSRLVTLTSRIDDYVARVKCECGKGTSVDGSGAPIARMGEGSNRYANVDVELAAMDVRVSELTAEARRLRDLHDRANEHSVFGGVSAQSAPGSPVSDVFLGRRQYLLRNSVVRRVDPQTGVEYERPAVWHRGMWYGGTFCYAVWDSARCSTYRPMWDHSTAGTEVETGAGFSVRKLDYRYSSLLRVYEPGSGAMWPWWMRRRLEYSKPMTRGFSVDGQDFRYDDNENEAPVREAPLKSGQDVQFDLEERRRVLSIRREAEGWAPFFYERYSNYSHVWGRSVVSNGIVRWSDQYDTTGEVPVRTGSVRVEDYLTANVEQTHGALAWHALRPDLGSEVGSGSSWVVENADMTDPSYNRIEKRAWVSRRRWERERLSNYAAHDATDSLHVFRKSDPAEALAVWEFVRRASDVDPMTPYGAYLVGMLDERFWNFEGLDVEPVAESDPYRLNRLSDALLGFVSEYSSMDATGWMGSEPTHEDTDYDIWTRGEFYRSVFRNGMVANYANVRPSDADGELLDRESDYNRTDPFARPLPAVVEPVDELNSMLPKRDKPDRLDLESYGLERVGMFDSLPLNVLDEVDGVAPRVERNSLGSLSSYSVGTLSSVPLPSATASFSRRYAGADVLRADFHSRWSAQQAQVTEEDMYGSSVVAHLRAEELAWMRANASSFSPSVLSLSTAPSSADTAAVARTLAGQMLSALQRELEYPNPLLDFGLDPMSSAEPSPFPPRVLNLYNRWAYDYARFNQYDYVSANCRVSGSQWRTGYARNAFVRDSVWFSGVFDGGELSQSTWQSGYREEWSRNYTECAVWGFENPAAASDAQDANVGRGSAPGWDRAVPYNELDPSADEDVSVYYSAGEQNLSMNVYSWGEGSGPATARSGLTVGVRPQHRPAASSQRTIRVDDWVSLSGDAMQYARPSGYAQSELPALRFSGGVDNYASYFVGGRAFGLAWNGGVWLSGRFLSAVSGYAGATETHDRPLSVLLEKGVFTRGVWLSGQFSFPFHRAAELARTLGSIRTDGSLVHSAEQRFALEYELLNSEKKCLFVAFEAPTHEETTGLDSFEYRQWASSRAGVSVSYVRSKVEYDASKVPTTVTDAETGLSTVAATGIRPTWFALLPGAEEEEWTDDSESFAHHQSAASASAWFKRAHVRVEKVRIDGLNRQVQLGRKHGHRHGESEHNKTTVFNWPVPNKSNVGLASGQSTPWDWKLVGLHWNKNTGNILGLTDPARPSASELTSADTFPRTKRLYPFANWADFADNASSVARTRASMSESGVALGSFLTGAGSEFEGSGESYAKTLDSRRASRNFYHLDPWKFSSPQQVRPDGTLTELEYPQAFSSYWTSQKMQSVLPLYLPDTSDVDQVWRFRSHIGESHGERDQLVPTRKPARHGRGYLFTSTDQFFEKNPLAPRSPSSLKVWLTREMLGSLSSVDPNVDVMAFLDSIPDGVSPDQANGNSYMGAAVTKSAIMSMVDRHLLFDDSNYKVVHRVSRPTSARQPAYLTGLHGVRAWEEGVFRLEGAHYTIPTYGFTGQIFSSDKVYTVPKVSRVSYSMRDRQCTYLYQYRFMPSEFNGVMLSGTFDDMLKFSWSWPNQLTALEKRYSLDGEDVQVELQDAQRAGRTAFTPTAPDVSVSYTVSSYLKTQSGLTLGQRWVDVNGFYTDRENGVRLESITPASLIAWTMLLYTSKRSDWVRVGRQADAAPGGFYDQYNAANPFADKMRPRTPDGSRSSGQWWGGSVWSGRSYSGLGVAFMPKAVLATTKGSVELIEQVSPRTFKVYYMLVSTDSPVASSYLVNGSGSTGVSNTLRLGQMATFDRGSFELCKSVALGLSKVSGVNLEVVNDNKFNLPDDGYNYEVFEQFVTDSDGQPVWDYTTLWQGYYEARPATFRVEGVGAIGEVSSFAVVDGGSGYVVGDDLVGFGSAIGMYGGHGTGLKLTVTAVTAGGAVTAAAVYMAATGTGYKVDDVLTDTTHAGFVVAGARAANAPSVLVDSISSDERQSVRLVDSEGVETGVVLQPGDVIPAGSYILNGSLVQRLPQSSYLTRQVVAAYVNVSYDDSQLSEKVERVFSSDSLRSRAWSKWVPRWTCSAEWANLPSSSVFHYHYTVVDPEYALHNYGKRLDPSRLSRVARRNPSGAEGVYSAVAGAYNSRLRKTWDLGYGESYVTAPLDLRQPTTAGYYPLAARQLKVKEAPDVGRVSSDNESTYAYLHLETYPSSSSYAERLKAKTWQNAVWGVVSVDANSGDDWVWKNRYSSTYIPWPHAISDATYADRDFKPGDALSVRSLGFDLTESTDLDYWRMGVSASAPLAAYHRNWAWYRGGYTDDPSVQGNVYYRHPSGVPGFVPKKLENFISHLMPNNLWYWAVGVDHTVRHLQQYEAEGPVLTYDSQLEEHAEERQLVNESLEYLKQVDENWRNAPVRDKLGNTQLSDWTFYNYAELWYASRVPFTRPMASPVLADTDPMLRTSPLPYVAGVVERPGWLRGGSRSYTVRGVDRLGWSYDSTGSLLRDSKSYDWFDSRVQDFVRLLLDGEMSIKRNQVFVESSVQAYMSYVTAAADASGSSNLSALSASLPYFVKYEDWLFDALGVPQPAQLSGAFGPPSYRVLPVTYPQPGPQPGHRFSLAFLGELTNYNFSNAFTWLARSEHTSFDLVEPRLFSNIVIGTQPVSVAPADALLRRNDLYDSEVTYEDLLALVRRPNTPPVPAPGPNQNISESDTSDVWPWGRGGYQRWVRDNAEFMSSYLYRHYLSNGSGRTWPSSVATSEDAHSGVLRDSDLSITKIYRQIINKGYTQSYEWSLTRRSSWVYYHRLPEWDGPIRTVDLYNLPVRRLEISVNDADSTAAMSGTAGTGASGNPRSSGAIGSKGLLVWDSIDGSAAYLVRDALNLQSEGNAYRGDVGVSDDDCEDLQWSVSYSKMYPHNLHRPVFESSFDRYAELARSSYQQNDGFDWFFNRTPFFVDQYGLGRVWGLNGAYGNVKGKRLQRCACSLWETETWLGLEHQGYWTNRPVVPYWVEWARAYNAPADTGKRDYTEGGPSDGLRAPKYDKSTGTWTDVPDEHMRVMEYWATVYASEDGQAWSSGMGGLDYDTVTGSAYAPAQWTRPTLLPSPTSFEAYALLTLGGRSLSDVRGVVRDLIEVGDQSSGGSGSALNTDHAMRRQAARALWGTVKGVMWANYGPANLSYGAYGTQPSEGMTNRALPSLVVSSARYTEVELVPKVWVNLYHAPLRADDASVRYARAAEKVSYQLLNGSRTAARVADGSGSYASEVVRGQHVLSWAHGTAHLPPFWVDPDNTHLPEHVNKYVSEDASRQLVLREVPFWNVTDPTDPAYYRRVGALLAAYHLRWEVDDLVSGPPQPLSLADGSSVLASRRQLPSRLHYFASWHWYNPEFGSATFGTEYLRAQAPHVLRDAFLSVETRALITDRKLGFFYPVVREKRPVAFAWERRKGQRLAWGKSKSTLASYDGFDTVSTDSNAFGAPGSAYEFGSANLPKTPGALGQVDPYGAQEVAPLQAAAATVDNTVMQPPAAEVTFGGWSWEVPYLTRERVGTGYEAVATKEGYYPELKNSPESDEGAAPAYGPNLLTDPVYGFEGVSVVSLGALAGTASWTTSPALCEMREAYSDAPHLSFSASAVSHGGSSSLAVSAVGAFGSNDLDYNRFSVSVALPALAQGGQYRLGVWVKLTGVLGEDAYDPGAVLRLSVTGYPGTSVDATNLTVGTVALSTADWALVTADFEVGSVTGGLYATLSSTAAVAASGAGAAVYLDDVELSEYASPYKAWRVERVRQEFEVVGTPALGLYHESVPANEWAMGSDFARFDYAWYAQEDLDPTDQVFSRELSYRMRGDRLVSDERVVSALPISVTRQVSANGTISVLAEAYQLREAGLDPTVVENWTQAANEDALRPDDVVSFRTGWDWVALFVPDGASTQANNPFFGWNTFGRFDASNYHWWDQTYRWNPSAWR